MSKNKSATEGLLEEGKILAAWPYKAGSWALSVIPVPAIDKVKFSFFKKATKGSGFDIYVDGIVFLSLVGILTRQNLELREKWEYRTGANGAKSLSLERGNSALVVVHGYNAGVVQDDGATTSQSATVGLNREQVSGMLTLYNMFFKSMYEEKWKRAYEIGQKAAANRSYNLTAADMEYSSTEEAEQTEQEQPVQEQPDGSVLVNMTLGTDLAEKGKFYVISVNGGGKFWVDKCEGYIPEAGSSISAFVQKKDENYKFLKWA